MPVVKAIERSLVAYLAGLSKVFKVTPESLRKDRLGYDKRGNQPPPDGGIACY